MTTTSSPTTGVSQDSVLGHLALHYRPGEEKPARYLLELVGSTLVDNGPSPGSDGFCNVLVNQADANYADNIILLSALTAEQAALESAIEFALRAGEPDEHPAIGKFRDSMIAKPESTSHIAIRIRDLEDHERVLADIEAAAEPGGQLEGRIKLVKYRPRPGGDPSLDSPVADRVAESPALFGSETPSFAPHWIQCFITTDLCCFGILAFGSTFELDYVFDAFFQQPPTFGTPKTEA